MNDSLKQGIVEPKVQEQRQWRCVRCNAEESLFRVDATRLRWRRCLDASCDGPVVQVIDPNEENESV